MNELVYAYFCAISCIIIFFIFCYDSIPSGIFWKPCQSDFRILRNKRYGLESRSFSQEPKIRLYNVFMISLRPIFFCMFLYRGRREKSKNETNGFSVKNIMKSKSLDIICPRTNEWRPLHYYYYGELNKFSSKAPIPLEQ